MGGKFDSSTARKNGPSFTPERQLIARHGGPVAGIDEAGRGPWAGPVVAAAVILDPRNIPPGLDDSKKLTERAREALYGEISAAARIGIGVANVAQIDRMNILQATLWSMRAAVADLDEVPVAALVDGNKLPDLPCPAAALVRGDALSLSVAAASIIAKVTRDRMMVSLAGQFPGYGWEQNKGYGTRAHASALERLGVTAHHRRSFRPIREALERAVA